MAIHSNNWTNSTPKSSDMVKRRLFTSNSSTHTTPTQSTKQLSLSPLCTAASQRALQLSQTNDTTLSKTMLAILNNTARTVQPTHSRKRRRTNSSAGFEYINTDKRHQQLLGVTSSAAIMQLFQNKYRNRVPTPG